MIIKDQIIYAMGENKETAVRVPQNEPVTFHTRDCFNNQIDGEEYVMDGLDWDHINPATRFWTLSWRMREPCAAFRETACWAEIFCAAA